MRAVPKAASVWQSDSVRVGPVCTVQRLRTRPQFQVVLASKLGVRTPHFALHSCELALVQGASAPAAGLPGDAHGQAAQQSVLGAMVPKRWAKRAVTRNAIKRQIYALSVQFSDKLAPRAHVVRLRGTFDRQEFISATSDALKAAVRAELMELFVRASAHPQLRA